MNGAGSFFFSNGSVFSDLDNDGDLDYVVNNIHETAFVFENKGDKINQSITIDLEGPSTNPTGIGAKVVLRSADGSFQQYTNYHTRGYMSSVDDRVFFGLGNTQRDFSLEVLWPDGKYQHIEDITPNSTVVVDYSDAVMQKEVLSFPLGSKDNNHLFTQVASDYKHHQPELGDFQVQRLLGTKISEEGPRLERADLNNDGLEDWMVFGSTVNEVQWNIQNSGGSFENHSLSELVNEQWLVETGTIVDINADGLSDIIVISTHNEYENNSYYSTAHFFLNKGSHLEAANDYQFDTQVRDVTPIDMDNDGVIELFFTGKTKIFEYPHPDPSMMLRQNESGWERIDDELLDYGNRNLGIAFAEAYDFDGDGFEDILLGGPFRPIEWMRNNAGQSFSLKSIQGFENKLGW